MWLLFMKTVNWLLYFYDWGGGPLGCPRWPSLGVADVLVTVPCLQAAIRRRRQLEHRGPAHPSQARLPGAVTVRGFPNTLIQVGHILGVTQDSQAAQSQRRGECVCVGGVGGVGGLPHWSSKELVRLYYGCLLRYRKDQPYLVCGVPKHMK